MKKILAIIMLLNSFLRAMDNKQLLIRHLKRGKLDNRHDYSQMIVFSKTPEMFIIRGSINTIDKEYWEEIEKGNFVYVPCYIIHNDSKEQVLKSTKAIIVGTTDLEDKKALENIFHGHSMQAIINAHPAVIFNTIKKSVEPKRDTKKVEEMRARL